MASQGGADYAGFLGDLRQMAGAVTWSPSASVRWRTTALSLRRNLDLRRERGPATRDDRVDSRVAVHLTDGWVLEPGAAAARRTDVLTDAGSREVAGLFALARHGSRWSLALHNRVGAHQSGAGPVLGRQHEGSVAFRPVQEALVGAFVTTGAHHDGSVLFTAPPQVGLRGVVGTSPGLTLEAEAEHLLTELVRDRVEGALTWTLPRGASVMGRVRWMRLDGREELAGQLALHAPFRVPLRPDPDVGRLEGRLVDGEDPLRPGLPGVRVHAGGRSAVTDRHGRFVIHGLPVGAYPVRFEREALDLDRVPADPQPSSVSVRSGASTTVDVALVRAARLTGKVIRVVPARDPREALLGRGEPLEEGGLGGLLVQITDGHQTLTRMTTRDGSFSFDGLRPGPWRVVLPASQLPDHHELVQAGLVAELAPGEAGEVQVLVRPRVRRVQLQDGGSVGVPRSTD